MYTFSQQLFVEMNFYEPKSSLIRPLLKAKLKLNTFFKNYILERRKKEILIWQKCQEVIDTKTFETEKLWVNNKPLFCERNL